MKHFFETNGIVDIVAILVTLRVLPFVLIDLFSSRQPPRSTHAPHDWKEAGFKKPLPDM